MTQVGKIQWELSGFSGAPGINTWYCRQNVVGENQFEEFNTQLRAFYQTLRQYLASGVVVSSIPVLRVYEDTTGELLEAGSLGPQENVTSIATGSDSTLSRATMAKLQFITNDIRRNRVLRGGIFFGPLSEAAIGNDGSILPVFLTDVNTAVAGLLDLLNARLVVWGQPILAADGTTVVAPGLAGDVQAVGVMSQPAVLRSRRD